MLFIQRNHVIEHFSSASADPSFGNAILATATGCSFAVPADPLFPKRPDIAIELGIVIEDDVAIRACFGECCTSLGDIVISMAVCPIRAKLAAKISTCWPDGVIEEFDTDESYFRERRWPLEQDLRKIQGASLLCQTESEEPHSWDDDDGDMPPPSCDEFQSYHVFFLAPDDSEFHFEDETESLADPDDPEAEQWPDGVIPGEGWFGWAVGISLVARFAVFNPCQYSQYEDGTRDIPDVESFIHSDPTNERVETQLYYRKVLGDQSYQKLLDLRVRIAAVLREHRIEVLDEAVLDLPLPGFKADEEIFWEEPLCVRDAFFFRGI